MDLCDLIEQDEPLVCSYEAEMTRKIATEKKIAKLFDHHMWDVDAALESELKAWEIWEKVNAGKR
jgi:hypothetical protein